MTELTPQEIVEELDKFIVGQAEAKRAVAIALRNRYRRRMLDEELQDEILPKNILMIGPTGVGKTEIARRLAKLTNSPFVKVEATKFTEVGYVGRDVESMVRDLVETAIRMVKQERMEEVREKAEKLAEDRLVEILVPQPRRNRRVQNPFEALFAFNNTGSDDADQDADNTEQLRRERQEIRQLLEAGQLEDKIVEIEVDDQAPAMLEVFSGSGMEEMGVNLQDILGGLVPKRKKTRKVTVKEARKILAQEEAQKLIDMDKVTAEAINRAENYGLIFIDEIDKIVGNQGGGYGPDVSREGVQRDILPIVEGSTVMTKYGPVKTDHVLFIAAGAFHVSKPSDLIPELQGRFPIRVELNSLTREDFKRILIEPRTSLIKQYTALLATEGVKVVFTDSGIEALADAAYEVNERTENIGARRLNTIMERVLEEVSFEAPSLAGQEFVIDAEYVKKRLGEVVSSVDLSRYIL
ncbi:MAG: ATP-dependent protease ATPase subunit HslU [Firmicutes bacterium]|nr:ATP-dependent protease ATPase subunit HslU [Bacillota bacterium]